MPITPALPTLDINAGIFVTPGGQSIITPDWLRAEDDAPNANPGGFPIFEVVQGPSHGTLLVAGQPASTFTMNDIDSGLVTYRQDGGAATGDQFTLALASDAFGNTIPNFVVPVTIATSALDHNTGTVVAIGQSQPIGGANLHVGDPGLGSGNPNADLASNLVYTITALPHDGTLSVNGTTLALGGHFTQAQIDSNLLTFFSTASDPPGAGPWADSFSFSISDSEFHNNFGTGTFDLTLTDTQGGHVFIGGSTPQTFFSGPGDNWFQGGSGTTVSYALAPPPPAAGTIVNLSTGFALNGFSFDTLINVHSVIGSSNGDILIAGSGNDVLNGGPGSDTIEAGSGTDLLVGGAGNDLIDGGSGDATAGYSGARSDYAVIWQSANSIDIVDNRPGSPDGTDSVVNVQNISFTDGIYTFDQLTSQITIETLGSTGLVQHGNNYYFETHSPGTSPELRYQGSSVVPGEFAGATPIAVEATATGYEVAWNAGGGQYSVWDTDNFGNFTSHALFATPGTSILVEAMESGFHQDLNGDGVIGINTPHTVIESSGSTMLVEAGNNYYLLDNSTGAGSELQYGGAPVVAGEFPGATPIAVEATATGYEIAWNVGGGQYSAWNIDSSGNYVSHALFATPGASVAVEALEPGFHQDLNGDGVIGFNPATSGVIETSGSTVLVEAGNNYDLLSNSNGTGPELQYGGAPVVAGEFGGAVLIGAEATATGYEVAWSVGGGQYSAWNVDSNGNYVSHALFATPGTDPAVESLEPIFHQDLNGDGVIGAVPTVIESFGSTKLVEVGNNYFLDSNSTGTGPELQYEGAPVVAGEFAGATLIGAEATATGYEVAWSVGGGQYSAWDVDSNGNYLSHALFATPGTDIALESLEPSFQQDLNGDSVIGVPSGSHAASVAVANNDQFVFRPGIGAEVIANASSAVTIELDGFSSVTSDAQLATLLTEAQTGQQQALFQPTPGGHDTVINLGNHDSITLTGVAIGDLHASGFIVH